MGEVDDEQNHHADDHRQQHARQPRAHLTAAGRVGACPAPDGGHDDKEHPHAAADLISRRGNPLSVGVSNQLVQRRDERDRDDVRASFADSSASCQSCASISAPSRRASATRSGSAAGGARRAGRRQSVGAIASPPDDEVPAAGQPAAMSSRWRWLPSPPSRGARCPFDGHREAEAEKKGQQSQHDQLTVPM